MIRIEQPSESLADNPRINFRLTSVTAGGLRSFTCRLGVLVTVLVFCTQTLGQPLPKPKLETPPRIVNQVGIDQKLGEQLPLDLELVDETGKTVRLGDYFGKKPIALTLVYYKCPSLCNQVLNGVTGALKAVAFDIGSEFDMLTVSIDPRETPELAIEKKESYLSLYGRPASASGWHFLTADDAAIKALTDAVGFRYVYDPASDQYAHGATVMVLTAEGKLSHYLFGLEYSPNDLRMALVEASERKIGTIRDTAMLLCFQYDPTSGKYGVTIMRVLRTLGVVFVGGTLMMIGVWLYREKHRAGQPPPAIV